MSKIVDITEKLNFEQKPVIKVKGESITVNNEAMAIIKIMPLLGSNPGPSEVYEICSTLFDKDDFEKISTLHLSFSDFKTLIKEAITMVIGEAQPGEAQIPATT